MGSARVQLRRVISGSDPGARTPGARALKDPDVTDVVLIVLKSVVQAMSVDLRGRIIGNNIIQKLNL